MTHYDFHPDATNEADVAAIFYKTKQPGLEKRFLEALEDAILRVKRNPMIYRNIEGNIRKCRLLHFPYGLIYRVVRDRIEIIAVMHLRKKPGYWRNRG